MTDAESLMLAFFRQEFQIMPYQARILLGLYKAPRALSQMDLAERLGMSKLNLGPGLHELRTALGDEYIAPGRKFCTLGAYRQVRYELTSHGRSEIDRMLRLAVTDLAHQLGLGRLVA